MGMYVQLGMEEVMSERDAYGDVRRCILMDLGLVVNWESKKPKKQRKKVKSEEEDKRV